VSIELANNPQGGEAVTTELAPNPQGDDVIDNGADTEGEEAESAPEPELEEVEHEGTKYKIPKALKPALMFQSDYTKKTQDLAKERDSWTETRTQQERIHNEHLQEVGKLYALNDKVAEWEKVLKDPRYAELERSNPGEAQSIFRQYLMDRDSLGKIAGEMQQKRQQKELDGQRESAKAIEQAHAAVARDVKDWNPQTFEKAKTAALKEYGFKDAEIANIADPRLLRMLNDWNAGKQAISKLAAIQKSQAAEETKPLPTVAGNAAVKKGLSDNLSTEEWMRRRNEQARNQGRRA
jgi:hypothetical protein